MAFILRHKTKGSVLTQNFGHFKKRILMLAASNQFQRQLLKYHLPDRNGSANYPNYRQEF